MKMKFVFLSMTLAVTMLTVGCASGYEVVDSRKVRLLVDNKYDASIPDDIYTLMRPYVDKVDKMMSPVVGHTAKSMSAYRPESPLSNLLADIAVWAGKMYDEKPVLGVYNIGGIRASISEGEVNYGNILEIAPFENKICFLTLSGENLLKLFEQIAAVGGEGVSKGVELVISKDGKLKSAKLHGKQIASDASYRIVTIDYLAEGNDKMEAFKLKTDVNAPEGAENNSREIIIDYFKMMQKHGKAVDADIEGRIKVSED